VTAGRRAARAWSLAALCLLALAPFGARLRGQAKPAVRHDIPFSTQIVTAHVPWATRLPGGPIRGFFVPPVSEGRDMVELLERLSVEPTTVTIDRNWDVNCWGIGDYYDGEHVLRGDRDDFRIVYGYVEEELTSATPFEVLVIPGLNGWSRYTRKTRDAILRRVSEGAGLVLLHPFVGDVKGHPFLGDEKEGDERIWDVSPLVGVPDDRVSDRGYPELNQDAITQGQWQARPHPITEGLDLDLLPSGARGGRFYRYQARGDMAIEAAGLPVVATRTYGKGRVVAFATVGDGFIPEAIDPVKTRTYWEYWEYQYSLLARAVLWAARGEAPVRIRKLTATAESGLTLVLASNGVKRVEVEARARSESGAELGKVTQVLALASGEGEVHEGEVHVPASDLTPAGLPGGREVVDIILRDPATGATLQWGWAGLDAPKAASLTGLRPNATVYREGDTMSVVARAAGDLAGLAVRVRFGDDLGRLRAVEEAPARGERTFFHRLDHVLGKRVIVSAELVDAKGRVVDTLREDPIVVAARERRRNDYRGLLSFETPVHHFAEQRLRLLHGQAMDTGFTWGGDVNDELHMPRGWFGVYWYDRGPTTPEGVEKAIAEFQKTGDVDSLPYLVKKELYRRTGETRFLVRTPSFDDPLVRQRLFDLARTAARSKAVYNMDYYFVGDEGSLGSYADPVDFCWGKHTLAAFREWLQGQYATLESLNRTWGSAFSRWDDVLPLTTETARREGRFAPWADHRTYMEVAFTRAYQTVRDGVVGGDPDGHIALSGTQVTTPWNGCDWHRLDAVVDDFLSYSGGNQWDIHRSFAKPGARIGFWTGYGRSGAPVRHEVWTAALQGVLHPQLFWSPSIFNPDMTFSRSARDLGAVFRVLRFEGVGRLLMEAERRDDGIAVHYSMASVHAAGILGHHPRREEDGDEGEKADRSFPANRDGWVKVLDDLGLSFRFVATPQVEEGALRGKKVFVLPYSLALSEREVAEIRRFVEEGGLLLADAGTGLFDEHVAWRQGGALDELFGIAAPSPRERVGAAPRASGPVELTAEARTLGLHAQDLAGLEALESSVHAGAGKPLARVGRADVAVVNHVGRGTAVYLNALLDRRKGERGTRRTAPGWSAPVRAILAQAGVRPPVSVTDPAGRPVSNVRIARYRFGDHEIVALLSGDLDVRTSFSRDGVTVYEDAALGRLVRHDVDVALPGTTRLTNVRTGEDLGETNRLHTTLVAGDALVLSLGPARTPLRLEGPAAAKRGQQAAFTVSAPAGGRRLLRWHVFGPDGAFRPEYAQVTVEDEPQATFTLPSALNDPAGEYRIRVADVLAGASAETTLRLE
jgi:glycosyl hydrolase family 42 (putative beta-galactosidase)